MLCRRGLLVLDSNLQCLGVMRKDDFTKKSDYANCLKCELPPPPFSVCIQGKTNHQREFKLFAD